MRGLHQRVAVATRHIRVMLVGMDIEQIGTLRTHLKFPRDGASLCRKPAGQWISSHYMHIREFLSSVVDRFVY